MKERPIIMGADSVRAILDGRKSMTRRVVKPQPSVTYHWSGDTYEEDGMLKAVLPSKPSIHFDYIPKCPYEIGNRLWVKEAWRDRFGTAYANYGTGNAYPIDDISEVDYKSGGNGYFIGGCIFRDDELSAKWEEWSKWKSPLFMPRWASRITLEITDIRVERVNDISEEDAIAEGIFPKYERVPNQCTELSNNVVEEYADLWDSLNAKRGFPFKNGPWVWVIEFKVVQP